MTWLQRYGVRHYVLAESVLRRRTVDTDIISV
jgi:hypothetical protein